MRNPSSLEPNLILMSLLNFLAPSAEAQEALNAVEIEVVDVAPGLLMLIGEGGNIGVSYGTDGVFLVDAQFAPLTDKILAAVQTRTDGPLRYLLNTHWHSDHTNGNENMVARGALIIAHREVRQRLSVDQFLGAFGQRVPAAPSRALPVITFSDTLTFHWNNEGINIFHSANAHTDGDAIVQFVSANAVHMGDTYFKGMYPFIDVDTGGTIDGMIAVADRVLSLSDADTRIIPGHGTLSNTDELQVYRDMLVGVRDAVVALIAEGNARQAVIDARPTGPYDAAWGGGVMDPDTFVGHVYDSLTGD